MDGAEFKGNDSPQRKFSNRGVRNTMEITKMDIWKDIFTLWVLEVEVHDALTPSGIT